MLLLRPGQEIKVRPEGRESYLVATLLEAGEGTLTLRLEENFEPGVELELVIPQFKDALYHVKARVTGGGAGSCTLDVLGEPARRERRKSQRIPARLRAHYHFSLEQESTYRPGEILDLSNSGALLLTELPLPVGSELMLTFELPLKTGGGFTTGIGGKVVRKHKGRTPLTHAYGVEFNRRLALSG